MSEKQELYVVAWRNEQGGEWQMGGCWKDRERASIEASYLLAENRRDLYRIPSITKPIVVEVWPVLRDLTATGTNSPEPGR